MSDLSGLVAHEPFIVLFVIDVLLTFLLRVGIVIAQIAVSIVSLGNGKVKAHSFSMANVQVSVGLWWETSIHRLAELLFVLIE